MNAASLIFAQRDEVRRYSTGYNYTYRASHTLNWLKELEEQHPTLAASTALVIQSTEEKSGDPRGAKDVFEARHVIVPGPGDVGVIERELGVEVPECLKAFYAQIQECLLLLRYPVRIYSPETLVAVEQELRAAERMAGCPEPDGVSLLRLVEIPMFSSCFALRRFVSDGQWRMIHCGDETTDELQRHDDLRRPEDVEDFDAWTRRILETDAVPLVRDNDYIFYPILAERVG